MTRNILNTVNTVIIIWGRIDYTILHKSPFYSHYHNKKIIFLTTYYGTVPVSKNIEYEK